MAKRPSDARRPFFRSRLYAVPRVGTRGVAAAPFAAPRKLSGSALTPQASKRCWPIFGDMQTRALHQLRRARVGGRERHAAVTFSVDHRRGRVNALKVLAEILVL